MSVKVRGNITQAVKPGLCTMCGTCAAVCPSGAIALMRSKGGDRYMPSVDEDRCTDCGTCVRACPADTGCQDGAMGATWSGASPDQLIGPHLDCHLARAVSLEIRYNAASGGLVTSLLTYALEQGMIDGALLTRMSVTKPLEPEPFIARSREEVVQAMGSKYCPVPANIALKQVLDTEGHYAVVGLPCHIRGIRRACEHNSLLRGRISLCLGIFCSHTLTFAGTDFLLRKMHISRSEVARISYRGRGWPGGVTIALKNGEERFIGNQDPLWNIVFGSFFFTPAACLSCTDVTNELADISFGDPWLPQIMSVEHEGISIAISRTAAGEKLLRGAAESGIVSLDRLGVGDVVRSQRLFLHFKKFNVRWRWCRGLLFRSACREGEVQQSLMNGGVALLVWLNRLLGRSSWGRVFLGIISTRLLGAYTGLFYLFYSRILARGG